ncbi:non-ribosomal peptide synthetase [Dactylosporangium vinaceum]|uniref:Non-ribosomal peptide synthetase n=1 Tax=Dactylosporangium vinaceum TaxID=53362 RepID=A0ABV5MS94_9ACTN|nr:non-ribosomal peptide synthetase [Dactylosporangium vinaceum]UAC00199.1 non-ribosomal peptide synthetase [Dactylosporangium vinaceum]
METLTHIFNARVAERPAAPAVVTPQTRWTYAQTRERALRIAAGLRAAGVGPGDRVGLLFAHSAEMVTALLGVLHLGAAYVPLDAAYPPERLAYMAQHARLRVVLAASAQAETATLIATDRPLRVYEVLDRTMRPDPHPPAARPGSEAYVLYTSGSTGRPKPIVQIHRNVLHHAKVWIDGLAVTSADRVSLQSAYSWDSAVQDTFAALLSGAALYPVDFRALGTGGLLTWMAAERITVYHSTLPIFRALAGAMAARRAELPALRVLALGGDTIGLADLDLYRRVFAAGCRLAGAYGSSECSCALLRVVGRDYVPPTGVFPLGFPVAETQVRLVDDAGVTITGPGIGEIVVTSAYLAPGATTGPSGGELRTGDLARRLDDGTLLLLGRRDFQVKIAGIRVETGEVESALTRLPEISEAVVMPFLDSAGERQLAGYVVPAAGTRPAPARLRAALRTILPDHAVPTAYIVLDALPLTANHKIDRAALPHPLAAPAVRVTTPPRDGLERAIADAWCAALGVPAVGRDDNFFDLGGTSLRLAVVHERLSRDLAPQLTMTDLYRAPTVGRLAALIDPAATAADPGVSAAAERGRRRRALQGRTARTSMVGEQL